MVVQEIICAQGSRNGLKLQRRLAEVKAVGKIVVSVRIGISERRQPIHLFNKVQNASEIVVHVRNVMRLGVG